MATADRAQPILHRLLGDDDLGQVLLSMIGVVDDDGQYRGLIAATQLRGVSTFTKNKITHSAWGQEYWRLSLRLWDESDPTADVLNVCAFRALVKMGAGAHFMKSHRKAMLEGALWRCGLSIRSDSWLCARFIDGGPLAPALEQAVSGMQEMAFLHDHTLYVLHREAIFAEGWEDACLMASDEEVATGEPVEMRTFHAPLDAAELSSRAKMRALRAFAEEVGGREAAMACMPTSMHERLFAALTVQEELRYAAKSKAGKRAQRLAAREAAHAFHTAHEDQLSVVIEQLEELARGPAGVELHLPKSLTKRARAVLHDVADDLELMHESRGVGAERHLVVWR